MSAGFTNLNSFFFYALEFYLFFSFKLELIGHLHGLCMCYCSAKEKRLIIVISLSTAL